MFRGAVIEEVLKEVRNFAVSFSDDSEECALELLTDEGSEHFRISKDLAVSIAQKMQKMRAVFTSACKHCGKTFSAARTNRRYCSHMCAVREYQKRKAEE